MYEPTQRRVIDFYADLVAPILAGGGPPSTTFLTRSPAQYWLGGVDRDISDLPPVLRTVQPAGDTYRAMVPSVLEVLFDWATGRGNSRGLGVATRQPEDLPNSGPNSPEQRAENLLARSEQPDENPWHLWPPEWREWLSARPTLARRPGVILLRPQVMWAAGGGIQPVPNSLSLVWPYDIFAPITLYTGQQLIGAGLRSLNLRPNSAFAQPFRLPLIRVDNFALPQSPNNLIAASGLAFEVVRTGSRARAVVVEGVDAATNADGGPLRAVSMIHLDRASHASVAQVRGDDARNRATTLPAACVQSAPLDEPAIMNWVECADMRMGHPARLGGMTEDFTLWSCHAVGTEASVIDGANNQIWFGAVEPDIHRVGDEDRHEIELLGRGCGIFAEHIEGELNPRLAAGVEPRGLASVVRIREGSRLCHVATSKMNTEGFQVLVERDSAAALVRQPTDGPPIIQALFNAGLTNLLHNACFRSDADPLPGLGWEVPIENVGFHLDPGQPYGGRASLGVVLPGRGGEVAFLNQVVKPGTTPTLISVADRTFAGGVWVRGGRGPGDSVFLTLSEGGGNPAPLVTSNRHSGRESWEFLSVLLHTSPTAEQVEFKVNAPRGSAVWLSQPMLVEGMYLPPFHSRPLTDAGGRLYGEIQPALPTTTINFQWPGGVGGSSLHQTRRVLRATVVHDVLAAVGDLMPGQTILIDVALEAGGREVPVLDVPLKLTAAGGNKASMPPQRLADIPAGARLHVRVRLESTAPLTGPPVACDLVVGVRLREAI
jgi:hypothetical protein